MSTDADNNGLILNKRTRFTKLIKLTFSSDESTNQHNCTIDDIIPLTRKPLFLIIDSCNSICMKPTKNKFGKPLVCLLSPKKQASKLEGKYFIIFNKKY